MRTIPQPPFPPGSPPGYPGTSTQVAEPRYVARLAEATLDDIVSLLVARLPEALVYVNADFPGAENALLHLDEVPPDSIYLGTAWESMRYPAILLDVAGTEMALTEGAVHTVSVHQVNVIVAVEALELEQVIRKTLRYARAVWMTLHDMNWRSSYMNVIRFEYSPILVPTDSGRRFRRAATVVLRVQQHEPWS
jgi:hypothetical protein